MADIILAQGEQLPSGTQVRYREMADGTYALVTAVEEAEIGQIGGLVPSMDTVTDAQVIIPVVHHEVHEGEMFVSSYLVPDDSPIADDGELLIHIFTGELLFPHFLFQASFGGNFEIYFYEGAIVSNNGTPLADVSLNRANVGVSTVQTFHTPTVTDYGSEKLSLFVPGGTFPRAGGGVIRANTEWPLARSTHYLIRTINRGGSAQPGSIAQTWYEESNA